MTLTTHAIAGAALASLTPAQPVLGFCLGFASHYALDAIPHWDYPLYSSIDPDRGGALVLDRALFIDLFDIGCDLLLGIALSFFFFGGSGALLAIIAGIAGGIAPDFLQFIYTRLPTRPIKAMQDLHNRTHSPHRLRQEGRSVLGIASQVLIIAMFVVAANILAAH